MPISKLLQSQTLRERFEYIGWTVTDNGCWQWNGHIEMYGYGVFSYAGKLRRANRVAYELASGQKLGTLKACHTCDNPSCVNPEHIYAGTDQDNVDDRQRRNRSASRVGINNTSARLTEDQVRTIRNAPDTTQESHRLAKQFGVAYTTVRDVVCGRTWKELL